MKSTHIKGLLALATIAVGLAILAGRGLQPDPHVNREPSPEDPAAAQERATETVAPADDATLLTLDDAPTRTPCRLSEEDHGAWHVQLTSTTHTGRGTPPITHQRAATLVAEVLQTSAHDATLLARFHDSSLSDHPLLENRFASPFLFRLDHDCGISAFAHHERTPRSVAREQQALLWELTWRWTDAAEPLAFDNTIGAHERTHAIARDRHGLLAQRSIVHYTRLWNGLEPTTPTLSLLTVRLGDAPWFQRAHGEEHLHLAEGTVRTTLEARTVTPPDRALDDAPRDPAHYRWAHLLPRTQTARRPPRPVTAEDRAARAELAHMDAAHAVEFLIDRHAAGTQWQDLLPVMTHWLEARPDQTEATVQLIASAGLPTQASNTLYMALGLARTPDAREWLHVIMDDPAAPPMHRTRAMLNLLDRDDVGLELAEALAERSRALVDGGSPRERFMARQSMLALGTMATMQQDPEITILAEETAIRALSAGHDPATVRPAVGTIANLGDPRLLPEVDPLTRHPDWQVRQASARAVRRMHPEDSEAFVLEWLRREASAFVRGELWLTISRQHLDHGLPPSPELAALAATQIHQNMDVGVQMAVLHIIGPLAAEHPVIHDSLERLARDERDTRSGLLEIAARHLDAATLSEVLQ
ncbi:MAG: HEAT repeat domain-containing protein [Deltaproteobacteria bacterium]|nr:MAG: HEAT repeat domain-containing protein [Deltaproteobacteria bacterium]